jgi:hypothetical protein
MLDPGGGGGVGIGAAIGAAAASLQKSTADFAVQAAEGHFAVSEEGGRALLQAIREMRGWIDGQGGRLTLLDQEPQLGGSHGAQAMKPFVQQVASDQQGFITMVNAFRDSLDKAEQGINDAIGNYRRMDTDLAKPYTAEA